MGMESYNITVLMRDVLIRYEDNYQKIIGNSKIDMFDVEKNIVNIGIQCIKTDKWIFDDYLEIYFYQNNGKFQGIEIKGCISCIKEGVKDVFFIIDKFKEWYGEVDTYILGEKFWYQNEEELDAYVQKVYENKIKLFNRQYDNIKLKITCGNFYKVIEKQNKWYNKLFHILK